MNHIAFQPAFDVYHTEFRMLRLLHFVDIKKWHADQLRILDFYLLYFFRLGDVRLSRPLASLKKLARSFEGVSYEIQPNDKLLFFRMSPVQSVALEALASNGLIAKSELRHGLVVRTGAEIPLQLKARVEEINKSDEKRMDSLNKLVLEYPFLGANGLKDRTGLMEHRYDSV